MRELLLCGAVANSISSSKRNFYMVWAECWISETVSFGGNERLIPQEVLSYGPRMRNMTYCTVEPLYRNCFMTSCRCWTVNNYSLSCTVWLGKSCYGLLEFHSVVSLKPFIGSVTLSWQFLIYIRPQLASVWPTVMKNRHQVIFSEESCVFFN